MKVTVIDYGLSNLLSVQHAFAHFGAEVQVTSSPTDVLAADALVLPGVGAFQDGMQGLEQLGLIEPIKQKTAQGTLLLGICLGMQMLFDESEEFGLHKGLGLIPGRVVRIPDVDADGSPQRVPHISWNPLYPAGGRTDFSGTALQNVQLGQECYFIHSYEAKPAAEEYRLADTVYGGRKVCAAAQKGCVIGTQFHPENPARWGLASSKPTWTCAPRQNNREIKRIFKHKIIQCWGTFCVSRSPFVVGFAKLMGEFWAELYNLVQICLQKWHQKSIKVRKMVIYLFPRTKVWCIIIPVAWLIK